MLLQISRRNDLNMNFGCTGLTGVWYFSLKVTTVYEGSTPLLPFFLLPNTNMNHKCEQKMPVSLVVKTSIIRSPHPEKMTIRAGHFHLERLCDISTLIQVYPALVENDC